MSDRFDFEQQLLKCWDITTDLHLLAEKYEHDDELCNIVLGIKHVYELRHDKLWDLFEEVVVAKERNAFDILKPTDDFFADEEANNE